MPNTFDAKMSQVRTDAALTSHHCQAERSPESMIALHTANR
jgi:hypothetical protein